MKKDDFHSTGMFFHLRNVKDLHDSVRSFLMITYELQRTTASTLETVSRGSSTNTAWRQIKLCISTKAECNYFVSHSSLENCLSRVSCYLSALTC